mgnify:CR=1 FL=1
MVVDFGLSGVAWPVLTCVRACLDPFGMVNGKWQKFWWQKFWYCKSTSWCLDAC